MSDRDPFLLIYVPFVDENRKKLIEAQAVSYCVSRGWLAPNKQGVHGLGSEHWLFQSDDPNINVLSSENLNALLQSGDVLVVSDVTAFGEYASAQEALVLSLIGRGIRIHVLDLLSPIEPHLPVLRAAWSAGYATERELGKLRRAFDRREGAIEQEREQFEADVVARMAERFGVKSLFANEPTVETEIGRFIKQERDRRGWTQEQLAERAETSKAMISRLETKGAGSALTSVLNVFQLAPVTPDAASAVLSGANPNV
jgi:hypothetical protein